MSIQELSYNDDLAELYKRDELPLIHLNKALTNHPTKERFRALIVANDVNHVLFRNVICSRLYDPSKMTLTLISPKSKGDLIGQCCLSNRCHDFVFISTEHLTSEFVLTKQETNLLKTEVVYF